MTHPIIHVIILNGHTSYILKSFFPFTYLWLLKGFMSVQPGTKEVLVMNLTTAIQVIILLKMFEKSEEEGN